MPLRRHRPHSALGMLAPAVFAASLSQPSSVLEANRSLAESKEGSSGLSADMTPAA